MTTFDWPGLFAGEVARYADVLGATALDADVPSCPDWDVLTLTDHLGCLHRWVDELIAAKGRSRIDKPLRDESQDLRAWFRDGGDALAERFRTAAPDPDLWTWATDQGFDGDGLVFWQRRMTHETLVHRYDLELAAEVAFGPVDPALAADGIDELWEFFAEGLPGWMTWTATGTVVSITATDVPDSWTLAVGRAIGTTSSGRELDLPTTRFSDDPPTTTVSAPAAQLHQWLWGRAPLPPTAVEGSEADIVRLRTAVADAT